MNNPLLYRCLRWLLMWIIISSLFCICLCSVLENGETNPLLECEITNQKLKNVMKGIKEELEFLKMESNRLRDSLAESNSKTEQHQKESKEFQKISQEKDSLIQENAKLYSQLKEISSSQMKEEIKDPKVPNSNQKELQKLTQENALLIEENAYLYSQLKDASKKNDQIEKREQIVKVDPSEEILAKKKKEEEERKIFLEKERHKKNVEAMTHKHTEDNLEVLYFLLLVLVCGVIQIGTSPAMSFIEEKYVDFSKPDFQWKWRMITRTGYLIDILKHASLVFIGIYGIGHPWWILIMIPCEIGLRCGWLVEGTSTMSLKQLKLNPTPMLVHISTILLIWRAFTPQLAYVIIVTNLGSCMIHLGLLLGVSRYLHYDIFSSFVNGIRAFLLAVISLTLCSNSSFEFQVFTWILIALYTYQSLADLNLLKKLMKLKSV